MELTFLNFHVAHTRTCMHDRFVHQDMMRAVHSDMLNLFKHCQELVKFGSGRGQREAFVTFADLLMVFAKQLRKFPHLASLVYIPDPTLQQTLQVLCCATIVFVCVIVSVCTCGN